MQAGFDAQHFADQVKRMAGEALSQSGDKRALSAVRRVQKFAEATSLELIGEDSRIACAAGCAHCCIVNVSVLQPEADCIAEHLFENRSAEELLDLYQGISNLEKETYYLDEEERIMARQPCAFLDNSGSCSIYPVRPLLCRSITSTDADACREALSMLALGENQPIVANLLHQQIFATAYSSFGEVLEEHHLDQRGHRLTASVRQRLDIKLIATN